MNLKIIILNATPIKTKDGKMMTRYEYGILDQDYCKKVRGDNFIGCVVVNGFNNDPEMWIKLNDFKLEPVDATFDYRTDYKDPMNQRFILTSIKGKNGALSLLQS